MKSLRRPRCAPVLLLDGDRAGAGRRSPARVTVSVIIVNWNAGQALEACLASLAAGGVPAPEVVLVDNASSDGSARAASARHPQVRLVETGANLGFAAGANRGAEAARGDVLVFLNPDARLLPGALATLVEALARTPGAGIAGGGLAGEGGGWQPAAARFAPLAHLLLDTTLGRLGARLRRKPHRVDWVYGTFMAVRRDLFRQLGGFDPRYFLYGEDLDLCYRAARLGACTLHVPAARAVHGPNLSAAQRFGHVRLFRAAAACKFGLKTALAAALGRRAAAVTYGRVVRACLTFAPDAS